jgi:hypothetical protein
MFLLIGCSSTTFSTQLTFDSMSSWPGAARDIGFWFPGNTLSLSSVVTVCLLIDYTAQSHAAAALWQPSCACTQFGDIYKRFAVMRYKAKELSNKFWGIIETEIQNNWETLTFVCLFGRVPQGRDAYLIYFLDPLPDCIVSTECLYEFICPPETLT